MSFCPHVLWRRRSEREAGWQPDKVNPPHLPFGIIFVLVISIGCVEIVSRSEAFNHPWKNMQKFLNWSLTELLFIYSHLHCSLAPKHLVILQTWADILSQIEFWFSKQESDMVMRRSYRLVITPAVKTPHAEVFVVVHDKIWSYSSWLRHKNQLPNTTEIFIIICSVQWPEICHSFHLQIAFPLIECMYSHCCFLSHVLSEKYCSLWQNHSQIFWFKSLHSYVAFHDAVFDNTFNFPSPMHCCISNGLPLSAEVCNCHCVLVQKVWVTRFSYWATKMGFDCCQDHREAVHTQ